MTRFVGKMIAAFILSGWIARGEEPSTVYTAAILPFQERGLGVKGYGDKVADLLFASLANNPNLWLVERAEIDKALAEQELGASGMAEAATAAQIGKLTGAKLFISGSVIEADAGLHIVAKVIGTESGRVLGESVKGRPTDALDTLTSDLADAVSRIIKDRGAELVPSAAPTIDRISEIRSALGELPRPRLDVRIVERHIGREAPDPAAETEFVMISRETGFEVVGRDAGEKADVLIQGEAFSEMALRRGNLVIVKARVEVNALDRATGALIAADRQTAVAVDVAEHIAGKTALQEASAAIAGRMLPAIVKQE